MEIMRNVGSHLSSSGDQILPDWTAKGWPCKCRSPLVRSSGCLATAKLMITPIRGSLVAPCLSLSKFFLA